MPRFVLSITSARGPRAPSGRDGKEAADRHLKKKKKKKKLVIRFVLERCPNVRASSSLFNTEEELEGLAEAWSRL